MTKNAKDIILHLKIQTFSQRLKNNSDKKGIHKNVKKTWVKPQ